ncbi:MAG: class I SAM-dependent methyltransferase [Pseudomonadota bacterium]
MPSFSIFWIARGNPRKGKTFLDVACGSGHRILDVAKAFPEAKFYAFDISEKSIELARQQAAQDGVENIALDNCNIMDFY